MGDPGAQPTQQPVPEQGLYLPDGYAARQMLVRSNWTVINVGVRMRQLADTAWTSTSDLIGDWRAGFGLCSAAGNPYGAAYPWRALVLTTDQDWTRQGLEWETGWRLLLVGPDGLETLASGDARLRVARQPEQESSAWYLRLTRTGGNEFLAQVFVPQDGRSIWPTDRDFRRQMRAAEWQGSVPGHSGHVQADVAFGSPDLAAHLDSVQVVSNVPDGVAAQLGGIVFAGVRAERLS